jgi:hypothetical protein
MCHIELSDLIGAKSLSHEGHRARGQSATKPRVGNNNVILWWFAHRWYSRKCRWLPSHQRGQLRLLHFNSRLLKKCLGEQLRAQNIVKETASYQSYWKKLRKMASGHTATEAQGTRLQRWKAKPWPRPAEPLIATRPQAHVWQTFLNKSVFSCKIAIIIMLAS